MIRAATPPPSQHRAPAAAPAQAAAPAPPPPPTREELAARAAERRAQGDESSDIEAASQDDTVPLVASATTSTASGDENISWSSTPRSEKINSEPFTASASARESLANRFLRSGSVSVGLMLFGLVLSITIIFSYGWISWLIAIVYSYWSEYRSLNLDQ